MSNQKLADIILRHLPVFAGISLRPVKRVLRTHLFAVGKAGRAKTTLEPGSMVFRSA